MRKDFFKEQIRLKFQEHGNVLYNISSEFISSEMSSSRSDVMLPIKFTDMEKGKFYFVFYDMQGKSSNIEKFSPILLVDWYDDGKTRQVMGISINFIPISIRTVFFNVLFNYSADVIEENSSKTCSKQEAIPNISFGKMYKMLQNIGFEWAIRKFDITKIAKVWCVNTNNLCEFLTMSTAKFTGVDDSKLLEIWKKKLETQKAREKEQIKDIIGDYKKMQSELDQKYDTTIEKEEQLLKSLQQMKKI